jgi:putative endopeptidase
MKPGLEKAAFKESVRPQDDLFRHVNGKWLDETEIPEDKAIHGSFHMLADDSELAVKEILEEAKQESRCWGKSTDRRSLRLLHGRGTH